jgi:hypothetical protein
MLRHLTVWHELTTRRLAEYQRTASGPACPRRRRDQRGGDGLGRGSKPRQAAGRPGDQLRRLRVEIAKLRDEQLPQLDFWPGGVVVGNTFGHYEEHRADLEPA